MIFWGFPMLMEHCMCVIGQLLSVTEQ